MTTKDARQESVDPTVVRRVVDGDATKSDKIRELSRLGMPTAEIARLLDIRYQFAWNVLTRDERCAAPPALFSASERDRITALTRGLRTKAARIRTLAAAGLDRSRVANALGLSYQHVYNVLSAGARGADRVADARAYMAPSGRDASSSAGAVPGAPDDDAGPDPVRAVVASGGRVAIPAAFLEALRISEGDSIVLTLEGDELRLYGQDAAIRRVQRLVARYVPPDVSLADELIAERRREAEREAD